MENYIENTMATNTSGTGKEAAIPREVRRFNWGAFFFTWIWGLFNNSFLTLISLGFNLIVVIFSFIAGLISGLMGVSDTTFAIILIILQLVIGIGDLALRIWFGARGNIWAWRNKRWKDTTHFNDVQRIWAIVSLVIVFFYIFAIVGIVAALTIPTLMTSTNAAKNKAIMLKSVNTVNQAALINEAIEAKCSMTSSGLAKCFGERITGTVSGNRILGDDYRAELTFTGDGRCKKYDTCYVVINTKPAGGTDTATLHLYSDKGYIKINNNDLKVVTSKYSNR